MLRERCFDHEAHKQLDTMLGRDGAGSRREELRERSRLVATLGGAR